MDDGGHLLLENIAKILEKIGQWKWMMKISHRQLDLLRGNLSLLRHFDMDMTKLVT